MTGKILALGIVVISLIFGAVVYYSQVYYFYEEVTPTGTGDVMLTTLDGDRIAIPYADFTGIDADSSPIRYRACFTTPLTLSEAAERFEPYKGSEPRNAPDWFECFNAEAIGDLIEAGKARVFTGQHNLEFGIDRVVALTDDGHGYVWHEINECGDKAYDGTPLGDDCPERP